MGQVGVTTAISTGGRAPLGLPWPIIACIAANLLLRCGSFAASVLLGLRIAQLNAAGVAVDSVIVGLLAGTFYVVELVGAPISGAYGDRFGHRLFLLVGPLFGAASAQLLGVTDIVLALFVIIALKGVSVATTVPATLAYLSAATQHDDGVRTRTFAWFEIGSVVGIGLGGLLGGVLWATLGPWSFTAVAAMYLGAFGFVLTIARNSAPPGRHGAGLGELGAVARLPRLLRFVPAWLAVNALIGLWVTHLPFLLAQERASGQLLQGGGTGATVGLAFGMVGAVLAVGIIVWGNVLAGKPRTVGMQAGVAGLAALTIVLAVLNRSGDSWGLVQYGALALALAAGFVAAAFTPAALAQLADIAEEQSGLRGAVMGVYSVLFGLGQVIGALIGGPAVRTFGADGLIGLTGALTVIAFFSVRWLGRAAAPLSRRPS